MSGTAEVDEIRDCWRTFLLEYELAKHYHHPYLLLNLRTTIRNPLLDALLPSLLVVRVVSLLDSAFTIEVQRRGGHGNDLNGRIDYLSGAGAISNAGELHRLRRQRNTLAHQPSKSITWSDLSDAIDIVETSLQDLGIVTSRPKLEYFGERSAMKDSPDPDVLSTRTLRCGVKEDGQVAIEFSWRQNLMKSK